MIYEVGHIRKFKFTTVKVIRLEGLESDEVSVGVASTDGEVIDVILVPLYDNTPMWKVYVTVEHLYDRLEGLNAMFSKGESQGADIVDTIVNGIIHARELRSDSYHKGTYMHQDMPFNIQQVHCIPCVKGQIHYPSPGLVKVRAYSSRPGDDFEWWIASPPVGVVLSDLYISVPSTLSAEAVQRLTADIKEVLREEGLDRVSSKRFLTRDVMRALTEHVNYSIGVEKGLV